MIASPTVAPIDFHGWDAIRLNNGIIDAICVPEIGGRLMQFSLGDYDFLFMNPELLGKRFSYEEHAGDGTILGWKNYGGDKTWPAPQGWDNREQWHGPPDPVLDSGIYSRETDSRTVTMTSPPDPRTGLRITRRISLASAASRLQLDLSFENVSERTIRWSIWDVAQLNCMASDGGINDDCFLTIPLDSNRVTPYSILFGDDNAQYQRLTEDLLAVQYQGIVGKIGVHSPAGWVAFANRETGFVLCMQFPYFPDAEYPDKGATVECWTESPGAPSPIPIRSPGCILEAEVLSPLYTLCPGESASHQVTWSAARCPGPIVAVTDVGCVHQPLRVSRQENGLRIGGAFGCFNAGRARLDIVDGDENPLHQIDLGEVSPLQALNLDVHAPRYDDAHSVHLTILNADSKYADTLAKTFPPFEWGDRGG